MRPTVVNGLISRGKLQDTPTYRWSRLRPTVVNDLVEVENARYTYLQVVEVASNRRIGAHLGEIVVNDLCRGNYKIHLRT